MSKRKQATYGNAGSVKGDDLWHELVRQAEEAAAIEMIERAFPGVIEVN